MNEDIDFSQLGYDETDESLLQFLSFQLGGESYAVDILSVEEIKSDETMTRVPQTPKWIRGVLNLRGTIVPVVDLRQRFDIAPGPKGRAEVVIILLVRSRDTVRRVGAIVDDVSDVIALAEAQIEPAPDLGSAISTEFIRGIATRDNDVVLVLDADRLFSLDELSRMDDAREAAQDSTDGQEED